MVEDGSSSVFFLCMENVDLMSFMTPPLIYEHIINIYLCQAGDSFYLKLINRSHIV